MTPPIHIDELNLDETARGMLAIWFARIALEDAWNDHDPTWRTLSRIIDDDDMRAASIGKKMRECTDRIAAHEGKDADGYRIVALLMRVLSHLKTDEPLIHLYVATTNFIVAYRGGSEQAERLRIWLWDTYAPALVTEMQGRKKRPRFPA